MSNVYFYFCNECANYISNDEIGDMSMLKEAAMRAGLAVLNTEYRLSLYKTLEGETMFTCECCKARVFGERVMYAGAAV